MNRHVLSTGEWASVRQQMLRPQLPSYNSSSASIAWSEKRLRSKVHLSWHTLRRTVWILVPNVSMVSIAIVVRIKLSSKCGLYPSYICPATAPLCITLTFVLWMLHTYFRTCCSLQCACKGLQYSEIMKTAYQQNIFRKRYSEKRHLTLLWDQIYRK